MLAALLWTALSGQSARLLMTLDMPTLLCGLVVVIAAVGIGLVLGLFVLALTPVLRRYLARASARSKRWVDPRFGLLVSLLICAGLLAYGCWSGNESGEGGLWGIFGVLKRQALDLRPVGVLLGLIVAIYLVPALFGWLQRPFIAWIVALVPLVLTFRAAAALNDAGDVAQLINRGAPLGRKSLAVLRKLTDRDNDGASGWFAGGDCNEGDPRINPAADEIPDNGIDEDCSGADLSLAALTSSAPKPDPPPTDGDRQVPKNGNVLLIVVDTLRADIGYAGYKRPITPNIDQLAKRSTIFERAYALASYTGKAAGPMLLGKYSSETHRNWGHFNRFSEEETFVAQRLKKAGVHTISIQSHRYFGPFGGLERGFDDLDLSAAPPEGTKWAKDNTVSSEKMTDAAIRLLSRPEMKTKRFFVWMQYMDPHEAYVQHKDGPQFGSRARDLYDGEIAFTDKHVGRLFDFIAQAPFADRTSIIFTSDHGEAFGEHGMWRHGHELWECLVHVPLFIYIPGAKPSVIRARRSQIDLVPTILDIMGLEAPRRESAPADSADFVSGISLLADVFLKPGQKPTQRDVLIDMPAGPYNDARRAFIHQDLKLIVSRGTHKELFDLAKDPAERRNIWSTDRGRIETLYAATKARLREIKVTGKRK